MTLPAEPNIVIAVLGETQSAISAVCHADGNHQSTVGKTDPNITVWWQPVQAIRSWPRHETAHGAAFGAFVPREAEIQPDT